MKIRENELAIGLRPVRDVAFRPTYLRIRCLAVPGFWISNWTLGYAPSLIPKFMKIKNYLWLLGMAFIVGLNLTLTACGGSDDSPTQNPTETTDLTMVTVNGAATTDISFVGAFENKSGVDYKQTVKIYSNVQWSVSGKPEWLFVSPSNGNGDIDVTIYPTSENSTSSPRTASIVVSGGGKSATINVTQEAGKPVCYVDIANEVVLYDRICWEYTATANVNTFQWILVSETEYNRMTDKEIEDEIIKTEELKISDGYLSVVSYDNNGRHVSSNTTYYIITLARDTLGKYGELRKTKLKTPVFLNTTEDAWVNFDNITSNPSKGFWFDAIKEGYCNTYHLIYGIIPASYIYNAAVYAFEINYYLKHKKKHWYADNWDMEIVTDYPNNHTFTYNTSRLPEYPRCFAYGWGVFKDGTLSSDIIGFQWDTSSGSTIQKIVSTQTQEKENILIRRSVEVERAKQMRR